MATAPFSSNLTTHCFRLRPGQDLKKELHAYCQTHQLQAACVLSSAGSVTKAFLRLSGGKIVSEFEGPFEIISLNGTLSAAGIHLHMSISDFAGKVFGGHLMDGCEIFTTAEIVLGESSELRFTRQMDEETGYGELVIDHAKKV